MEVRLNGATAVPLNAVPDVVFSEALNPATVIAANVYLYSSATGKPVASTLTLDTTGTVIHLTPSAALTASTQYYFDLYNLTGVNGLAGVEPISLLHDGQQLRRPRHQRS